MPQLSGAVRLFRAVEMEFDGFSPLPLELALVECALPSDRSATLEKLERATEPPQASRGAPAQPAPSQRKPPGRVKPAGVEPSAQENTKPTAKVEEEKEAPAAAEPTAAVANDEPASPLEPAGAEAPQVGEVEATPPPTHDETATSSEVERVRARWKEVVAAAKGMGSRGNLDALLRSACEPIDVKGDTIVLGFYYDFHKEKIEDPKYRTMVEAKVLEIFGKPYKIRCQLTERKTGQRGHVVDAALRMGATIIDDEEEIPNE